ncbi:MULTISPECIES: hypothetical protein [unclassified Oceanispirochaeta]|uniref:hypothetical protein n=1 Tax=unclassified Oceanispirochaeta TaxID=2635722 RepID=UPI000E0915AF|nr:MULTISPECIES: hypothetical protein [unclassified Oceanispirochaeta]MBF9015173.1 hypothetical protein [Oceanispirochaeta sp. M2]NPD71631.1 hypothetical protein [Oceanispirochaeta sp. M1]RDG33198.1 hypothetical protein DV872_05915 [Oceanispirochaeta sp. M1]
MTVLVENDLEFDFSPAIEAINFDDDALHNPSTIKRVDFIAEFDDRFIFLEVKDPDIPGSSNPEAFKKKLLTGNLIPNLAAKYRDSYWFRSHSGNITKRIYYVVLISMASLEPALLLSKQDQLKQSLPLTHKDWSAPCAAGCVILNLDQYKKQFGSNSVRRLSAGGK